MLAAFQYDGDRLEWEARRVGARAHRYDSWPVGEFARAPTGRWAWPSVADGEAALHEARQLRLIDQGDGRVLHRDAASAVSVQDRLVAADPEAACSPHTSTAGSSPRVGPSTWATAPDATPSISTPTASRWTPPTSPPRRIFSNLTEVELRLTRNEPTESAYYGERFLWTALFRRDD